MSTTRVPLVLSVLGALVALPTCGKTTNPSDVDNDHDGFTVAQGDCDDANAAIKPGGDVLFTIDYAFSGTSACATRNPRQQVYTLTNHSCAAVTLQGLQVTLALGGTCSGSQTYSLPLETSQVAPGATAPIRHGAPAGSVVALCCQEHPCPQGACTVALQYTLATSAGARMATQGYTVDDATGRDCPVCGSIGTDETMRPVAPASGEGQVCIPAVRPY